MHRSPDAATAWEHWYSSLDDSVRGRHGSLVARAEVSVTRLSPLYALLDGSAVIHPCHHAADIAVWDHCEETLWDFYPPAETTGNGNADRILMALSERGRVPKSDAYCLFHGHIMDDQFDAAVGVLTATRLVVEAVEGTGGRPQHVIRLPS